MSGSKGKLIYGANLERVMSENCMSKLSKISDVVFHRAVFAATFLLYLILVGINVFFNFMPPMWGTLLFIPLLLFGLLGYFVDEIQSK